jgi:hypothetical protein
MGSTFGRASGRRPFCTEPEPALIIFIFSIKAKGDTLLILISILLSDKTSNYLPIPLTSQITIRAVVSYQIQCLVEPYPNYSLRFLSLRAHIS